MNALAQATALEICPECNLCTASGFFRNFDRRRLCVLCAADAEKAQASQEERQIGRGQGRLWKQVGVPVCTALGLFSAYEMVRGFLPHH